MSHLFDAFKLKDVSLRNRIGVSQMCQYSSEDGIGYRLASCQSWFSCC